MYVWSDEFIIPFSSVTLVKFEKNVYFLDRESDTKMVDERIIVTCAGEKIELEGQNKEIFLAHYKEYLAHLGQHFLEIPLTSSEKVNYPTETVF